MKPKPKTTEADASIGVKLKELRTLRGVSQADIGKALDVSFQQIQKYERGVNRISAAQLYTVSNMLGVSMNAFFEENEELGDLDFDNQTKRLFKVWSSASSEEKKDILKMIKIMLKTST